MGWHLAVGTGAQSRWHLPTHLPCPACARSSPPGLPRLIPTTAPLPLPATPAAASLPISEPRKPIRAAKPGPRDRNLKAGPRT
jgi:hypothetical protein